MKLKKLLLTTLIFTFALPLMLQGGSRIYIKVKPPTRKIVVVKPAQPNKKSVWIKGRWHWNGRKYVWKVGSWSQPRKGFVWAPGHWKHNRRGWHWVDGSWKRA